MMDPLNYASVDLSIDVFWWFSYTCPKQAFKQLYVAEFQLLFNFFSTI